MKKIFTLSLCFILCTFSSFGNGVAVVDAANGTYLQLIESHVEVTVNNQIATTKARHIFKNPSTATTAIIVGSAPGMAPTKTDSGLMRLSGV